MIEHLGGCFFDARGILQLSGAEIRRLNPGYPERVSRIPIEAAVREIHFLHGVGWTEREGVEVARYVE